MAKAQVALQARLVQSRGVALFREFDRRLPSQANLQTLYFDTFDSESRPWSRPSSATFQRYATVAITDLLQMSFFDILDIF
jgi:hypothetical protein